MSFFYSIQYSTIKCLAASTNERLSQLVNTDSGQGTTSCRFFLIRALIVVENYDVKYNGTNKRAKPLNRSNWYEVDLTPVSSFLIKFQLQSHYLFRRLDALEMLIKLLWTQSINML